MSKRLLLEFVFMIVAILSLWPIILGWSGIIYKIITGVVLVGLVLLLVDKFRAINRSISGEK